MSSFAFTKEQFPLQQFGNENQVKYIFYFVFYICIYSLSNLDLFCKNMSSPSEFDESSDSIEFASEDSS